MRAFSLLAAICLLVACKGGESGGKAAPTPAKKVEPMKVEVNRAVLEKAAKAEKPEAKAEATAPALKLADAEGEIFDLDVALGQGPVVVVFYRGDWCPKCKAQLEALGAAKADFEAKGAQVVAVSIDPAEKSKAFASATGFDAPILVDADLAAIRAWGVEDVGHDIAKPATFVVGKDKKLRYRHIGENPGDRPAIDEILAAI